MRSRRTSSSTGGISRQHRIEQCTRNTAAFVSCLQEKTVTIIPRSASCDNRRTKFYSSPFTAPYKAGDAKKKGTLARTSALRSSSFEGSCLEKQEIINTPGAPDSTRREQRHLQQSNTPSANEFRHEVDHKKSHSEYLRKILSSKKRRAFTSDTIFSGENVYSGKSGKKHFFDLYKGMMEKKNITLNEDLLYANVSPRHKFLNTCIDRDMVPEPLLIRENEHDSTLNYKHYRLVCSPYMA